MSINRRNLLQCTGAGCALALLPPALDAACQWRRYLVQDGVALPRFAPGDIVIADAAVTRFSGDGYYLYPAWGQPRLYDVRLGSDRLVFRNPGSGRVLWTQSLQLDASFSGKALDDPGSVALANCPALSVPALPAVA